MLEETGAHCALGPELPTVRYPVEGRPKEVRYWAAEATGGGGSDGGGDGGGDPSPFTPNDEVDRVVWLSPGAARGRLTQQRDRELVTAFLAALRPADSGAAPH
ncbi:hypothetical protein SYYSPA8_35880 [Streptomyces yaizuensis]|uniref:NUDIX hydrolase n=1 Tax=Streptomyces yaizuensis TaxID=2989713 RepID=A0ABQ5PB54_9ACTN|nr:hypothetical protein SYYSPA8_35880 [Streptomyces sp. YSPA8]